LQADGGDLPGEQRRGGGLRGELRRRHLLHGHANRHSLTLVLAALLLALASCGAVARQAFESPTARPRLQPAEILLDTGRKYGVVASGIGVTVRATPDPTAASMGSLKFTQIVATTGEASGADGQVWRRISTGGWVARDGLLVFSTLREALNLVVELRVFSGPDVRRPGGPAPPRPPAPAPTGTIAPGATRPATTSTATTTATVTRTPTPSSTPTPAR